MLNFEQFGSAGIEYFVEQFYLNGQVGFGQAKDETKIQSVLGSAKYKEDYEKMERESIRLSEGKLQEEKFSEKAAETFAWISAEVKMMLNDDSSKIAEMMIDGANMGIKSITEKLNRYPEAEKESISLAKKFEKTCEKLIQDMKKYL